MRVVVLHRGFTGWGGAEALALAQARDLAQAGMDVRVVTFAYDRERWHAALDGLPVTVVPRRSWRDLPRLFDRRSVLEGRRDRLAALLRDLAPDVVLAHNHPAPALLGACPVTARKLWYCHEPPRTLYPRPTQRHLAEALRGGLLAPQQDLAGRVRRALAREDRAGRGLRQRLAFDQAGVAGLDGVAANSWFTRDAVAAAYGGLRAEVHYPAVALAPRPHRPGLDRAGLQVLAQARLDELKNVEAVLRGFRQARRRLGSSPCLHVVGQGPCRPALERLAADLGLGAAVRFHGFLAEPALDDLRRRCDVFALLPWDEPFGLVFPEAAAAGLLLVGPDHGGPAEILGAGEHGWCVPPHAYAALADVLAEIWGLDDAEVDRRRWQALTACRRRFAPEVVLPRFRAWLAG